MRLCDLWVARAQRSTRQQFWALSASCKFTCSLQMLQELAAAESSMQRSPKVRTLRADHSCGSPHCAARSSGATDSQDQLRSEPPATRLVREPADPSAGSRGGDRPASGELCALPSQRTTVRAPNCVFCPCSPGCIISPGILLASAAVYTSCDLKCCRVLRCSVSLYARGCSPSPESSLACAAVPLLEASAVPPGTAVAA